MPRLTRKLMPWSGWPSEKPTTHQRTDMKRKCKSKCFLGPKKSFPICRKNTCKVSNKGLYAAYVRARQWGSTKSTSSKRPRFSRRVYTRIANKAKRMLKRRGFKGVGTKGKN
jgi:hypothetical protein